ncbi:MAG: T9SS type A sorting domain-containing protein [Rhodothermales bacterium]|nr:T9SS type A sorting domain-containing protein [Rhodothermales bacterium]MBO6779398.1 T9SS type A sorting domain-containing protein [Rhodothermales bacterium]
MTSVRIALPLVLLAAAPICAAAQDAPPCGRGTAVAVVEGREVQGGAFSSGFLYFATAEPREIVQWRHRLKGFDASLVFGAGIWLSGSLDGELRASVAFYGRQDFWPGPLGPDGQPAEDCTPFDRIWSVSKADLTTFAETGVATDDLVSWPTGLGAPTLDASGNRVPITTGSIQARAARTIDLDAGEWPLLRGDVTHWWVVNDVAEYLESGRTPPLFVEVGVTAFAFDVDGVLGRTLFYEFDVRKPAGATIEDAFVGFYTDMDLGDFDDDYMGSDSVLGMVYTYNAVPTDAQWGERPPAVGMDILRGPRGPMDERTPMTSAILPSNTRTQPEVVRNYFLGKNRLGSQLVSYGRGHPEPGRTDPTTRWHFWGEPGTFWSELDSDGSGTATAQSDRRIVSGAGPVPLGPEHPQDVLIAVITSIGEDHVDSVRQLKADDRFLQRLADDGILDIAFIPEVLPTPIPGVLAASLYPVPAADFARLEYHLPLDEPVEISVFDALGRPISTVPANSTAGFHEIEIDTTGLRPGLYLVRIRIGSRLFARSLVVAR